MVAKISFAPAYNVMLMSRLSSLRHMTRCANAYVVVRTRLKIRGRQRLWERRM